MIVRLLLVSSLAFGVVTITMEDLSDAKTSCGFDSTAASRTDGISGQQSRSASFHSVMQAIVSGLNRTRGVVTARNSRKSHNEWPSRFWLTFLNGPAYYERGAPFITSASIG
jgi:hypothetical protein